MKTFSTSQEPTQQEKLALVRARLKELYSQQPSYAKHAAAFPDPDVYWDRLAQSHLGAWQSLLSTPSSTPAAAEV